MEVNNTSIATQPTRQQITAKRTANILVNEMDQRFTDSEKFKNVIETHNNLINTLITEYNHQFDQDETSRFSRMQQGTKHFFSQYIREHTFEQGENHFTGDFSQRVGINMIIHEILDTFKNSGDNKLETHKAFMCMVLTPLCTQKDYDMKVKNIANLLNSKDDIKFILTNQDIVESISNYINSVSDYVQTVGKVNLNEEMTINRLKKQFFCPDIKRMLKSTTTTMSEDEITLAHNKHRAMYSGAFRYPAQYYVLLGLTLRCFIMMSAPNESRKKASIIMRELIRQAY